MCTLKIQSKKISSMDSACIFMLQYYFATFAIHSWNKCTNILQVACSLFNFEMRFEIIQLDEMLYTKMVEVEMYVIN